MARFVFRDNRAVRELDAQIRSVRCKDVGLHEDDTLNIDAIWQASWSRGVYSVALFLRAWLASSLARCNLSVGDA